MDALKVDRERQTNRTSIMRITGWTEQELEDLRHLHYQDMKNAVLEELDRRNGGLGTCWHNAYYVFQMWVRDDAVMVEIGNSSD